ncbi:hypothetical protein CJP74_01315 [Psittacicella melopsittaci]|uniref:Type I restriction modification DNA specificity domain-containing protein n=1 Tax=Psittacicella melopsittaci TaxID=2028576 RepID=A0A3A1Y8M0_9GAMM|nr:restriction endonuclease subunit S [Psittacicella melopsittaci]RIY33656.1 hypothetical protein CJP74_01315 [Psittacicella melopsittaci]
MEELKSSIPTNSAIQVKVWNTFTTPINNVFKESTLNTPKSSNKVASVKPVARKKRDQPRLRFPEFTRKWSTSTLSKFLELPIQEKVEVTSIDQLLTLRLHLKGLALCKDINLQLGATDYYKRTAGQLIYGKQNFLNKAIAIIPKEFDGKCSSKDVPSFNIKYGDPDFIYYCITRDSYIKSKEMYAKGTGSKRISEKSILTFEIIFPSLEEQQKIGNFFKDIEEKISSLNNAINVLVKLKSSLGQKVFPINDNKKPELRFAGFSSDWKSTKLKEFCTWSKGSDLKKDKLNFEGKGDLALHYGDLFALKGYITRESLLTYTEYDEGAYIPTNSLLFPDSDVTPLGLATASAIDTPNVRASGGVIIGAIKDANVASSFIAEQLVCNKEKFYPFITGTTVRHINPKGLEAIKVLIPSLEEQLKVSSLFKELEALERKLIKQKTNYEVFKQALLQRMFV